jgi:hypothetical protein
MSDKMIIHEGKRYRTADRMAYKGELVVIETNQMHHDLEIGSVHKYDGYESAGGWYVEEQDGRDRDYLVLIPLEDEEPTVDSSQASPAVIASVDESQASAAVVNMFTALSRKIVSLECQLADTQRNVERQAEELENAKHVASKALRVTGDHGGWLIRNAERLNKSEEIIEMLTDDVITLDERSQVLNAITKFYERSGR